MRDCPSADFYTMGPNGLPVKKRDASQEKQKPRETPDADKPRALGVTPPPPPRQTLPEWGSSDVKKELVKEKEKSDQKTDPKEDQLTLCQALTRRQRVMCGS